MYYDKDGLEIDVDEWTELFSDKQYQIIQQDKIGNNFISTVWLGLNHSWNGGGIKIFETMVFNDSEEIEQDMERYETEAEAIRGHERFLEKYTNREQTE